MEIPHLKPTALLNGTSHNFQDVLIQVQKPARYIGREINSVRKNPEDVAIRMALCFPDVYEVGMSHLGLKILYNVLNSRSDIFAERAFAPWPDMEKLLREKNIPLTTLETGTPLKEMDFLGFSLQYELCATTVLQMLDLAGLRLRAEDRSPTDPVVVAGGPVAFNPAPLSPFFDAFVLGDGEEVILDLADAQMEWKREKGDKNDLLESWKKIPGVYVPSLHKSGELVKKRTVPDLNQALFPSKFIVPFCETVHDRIGVEIARGCTRGCRFCQAGMLYRPVREREPDELVNLTKQALDATGWEEIALLSLSSGDYSCIAGLVQELTVSLSQDKVAISLPSLRTDTFDPQFAEDMSKVRKTGFTLAPEAGTDRLRRAINKGNTEEDLENAVKNAFRQGRQSIKLYFLIGIPSETDEDLDGIIDLIRKASKWSGGRKITAAISTLVPKSHTPFQWTAQIDMDETIRRQNYIRRFFQKGKVKVKFHSPKITFLEGIIARGDVKIAEAIEKAFQNGARFDSWDDMFRFDMWMRVFEETGIDPAEYLRSRDLDEQLPWHFIDTGIKPEYLKEEWRKAHSEEATPDCRNGKCTGCGVCDFKQIKPNLAAKQAVRPAVAELQESEPRRFRLKYGKSDYMRYLGHQDVIRLFERAFRRASLKLDFSKGFHPHARLRFSPPLALGIESVAEFLDFDLVRTSADVENILQLLTENLPQGIKPSSLHEISLKEQVVSGNIHQVSYDIHLNDFPPDQVLEKVELFSRSENFDMHQTRRGLSKSRDLKKCVSLKFENGMLKMIVSSDSGLVHPLKAISAILGVEDVGDLRIIKTDAEFGKPSEHERSSDGE